MRILAVLGITLCAAIPACWPGEFNYASYTQKTLQDIITQEQDHSFEKAGEKQAAAYRQFECKTSKYRVSCGYSSIRRPISEKKKNAIKLWMETLNIDPNFAALYQQEIRVTEGSKNHWIPIQEQLIPHIRQELIKNDPIELFILFIGTVESEFVFIATEFEKPVSPAGNPLRATGDVTRQ